MAMAAAASSSSSSSANSNSNSNSNSNTGTHAASKETPGYFDSLPASAASRSASTASPHSLSPTSPPTGTGIGTGGSLTPTAFRERSHLAPEDAFFAASPPRREQQQQQHQHQQQQQRRQVSAFPAFDDSMGIGNLARPNNSDPGSRSRSRHHRHRSGKRSSWKKLLWVKQSYPDNYTDQATFLENLQRNPRLQPYDFWPLVADSTVIVQHVCSVIIFVVCFVGIFQDRVSPVSVVTSSSFATLLGWLLWELWEAEEDAAEAKREELANTIPSVVGTSPRPRAGTLGRRRGGSIRNHPPVPLPVPPSTQPSSSAVSATTQSAASSTTNLSSNPARQSQPASASASASATSLHSASGVSSMAAAPQAGHNPRRSADMANLKPNNTSNSNISHHNLHIPPVTTHANSSLSTPAPTPASPPHLVRHRSFPLPTPDDPLANRASQRLGTIKSALLIYSTLLGLSPILKSLTRSTSSDSIWAMSFWLLAVNIFSFDYSTTDTSATASRVPASLSTNAALMASTVLASRLPSTGQVFSLTMFSIEVFGLFPVFRRCARHRSWSYHYIMTALLVLGAGAGVGIIAGDPADGHGHGQAGGAGPVGDGFFSAVVYLLPWKRAVAGMVVSALVAALAMGACSWWLIGLQKYKNEIYGPWDPARPIIISRRLWDDG